MYRERINELINWKIKREKKPLVFLGASYLRYYFFVGGMPEAVLRFSQNRDWNEVRSVQNNILKAYESDFSKHAPTDILPRINLVWKSIPSQLAKENRKFFYGVVKEGARAREYEEH